MRLIIEGTPEEIAEVVQYLGIDPLDVKVVPIEEEGTPITRDMFPEGRLGTLAFRAITRHPEWEQPKARTLEELAGFTRKKVFSWHHCGTCVIAVVEQVLAKYGLAFSQ